MADGISNVYKTQQIISTTHDNDDLVQPEPIPNNLSVDNHDIKDHDYKLNTQKLQKCLQEIYNERTISLGVFTITRNML